MQFVLSIPIEGKFKHSLLANCPAVLLNHSFHSSPGSSFSRVSTKIPLQQNLGHSMKKIQPCALNKTHPHGYRSEESTCRWPLPLYYSCSIVCETIQPIVSRPVFPASWWQCFSTQLCLRKSCASVLSCLQFSATKAAVCQTDRQTKSKCVKTHTKKEFKKIE